MFYYNKVSVIRTELWEGLLYPADVAREWFSRKLRSHYVKCAKPSSSATIPHNANTYYFLIIISPQPRAEFDPKEVKIIDSIQSTTNLAITVD